MDHPKGKTVRLLMPQWQGGNNGVSYPLGARLLDWLAPAGDAIRLEVPVDEDDGTPLPLEDGIRGRSAIVRQLRAARHLLDAYQPDRVVTFGGDCLVSQAPFAYLNERYGGRLGVLWLDAHPDVTTPADFAHAHAMVLGNLLGGGDPGLAKEVPLPLDPKRVLLAGIDATLPHEAEAIRRAGLRTIGSGDIAQGAGPILDWLREAGIEHLAIHFDLDILDPVSFRSLLFNNPNPHTPIDAQQGVLTLEQVTRVIVETGDAVDVVGLTFAEHMPWDDINLRGMLARLPLLR